MKKLDLYLPYNGDDRFWTAVVTQARSILARNKYDISIEDIIEAIVKDEYEKAELARDMEAAILFNDEIESIEYLDEREMMDITVSRDNLFIANGIVTKNSFGIPATADFMISLMRTEELDEQNQVLMKQIKSRYGNKSDKQRFLLGVNQAKQTYFDVEEEYTRPQRQQQEQVAQQSFAKSSTKTTARLAGLS